MEIIKHLVTRGTKEIIGYVRQWNDLIENNKYEYKVMADSQIECQNQLDIDGVIDQQMERLNYDNM